MAVTINQCLMGGVGGRKRVKAQKMHQTKWNGCVGNASKQGEQNVAFSDISKCCYILEGKLISCSKLFICHLLFGRRAEWRQESHCDNVGTASQPVCFSHNTSITKPLFTREPSLKILVFVQFLLWWIKTCSQESVVVYMPDRVAI